MTPHKIKMPNGMHLKQRAMDFLQRHRWHLSIVAGLYGLYGALGFWVAPGIVHDQLVKQMSAVLDRPVKLGTVRINPYTLSVRAENLALEERDGSVIASFDEAYVNFSLSSLFRFAWTFSEIRLTHPHVALVVHPDGAFNLAALGAASPPKAERNTAATVPRLVVGQLTVVNGRIGFEDQRGKRPFAGAVDSINFSLHDFSTLPDDEGLHSFSAATDLGERLTWRGRIGVNPLQSQGQLELSGVQVPRLADYLLPGSVKVSGGTVDLMMDYRVKLQPAGASIALDRSRLALHDVRASLPSAGISMTPLNLEFSPVALKVDGVSGSPGSRANIELNITPNGSGSIAVRGTFGFNPQTADLQLQLKDVALAPFQPFLEPYARLRLERGALQAAGRFELGAGKAGTVRFTGAGGVTDFASVDDVRGESFARWRALQLDDIRLDAGSSFSIARITVQDPYLRVGIGADRVSNLQRILGNGSGSKPADASAGEAKPAEAKSAATGAPAMRTRIGLITVRNGSANFSDQSLQPNFSTGIQQLNGTIKGLSSQADARAAVALRGKVDRYAPVTIEGEINPLAAQAYTDIALRFENIELTTFTPYSGKFAGRRIEKGKLNLDLRYKLVERELDGENKIVLDQFTLGDRVESPDALDLPLQLAIAILKDTRGVIDIDMPVHGNLDDPKFSYGGLVLTALRNLIMKAVTAPFSLLAASLGGGEELGYVAFAPGSGELDPAQQAKLDKLAQALANRPALTLEIHGSIADDSDRQALATAKLMQQVRGKDAAAETPLTSGEKRRLLALYRKTHGDDPKVQGDTEAEREARKVEEARTQLVAATPVAPEALQELARNRGLAIGEYLVTRANVAKERVFLGNPGTGATTGSDGVHVEMKLGAR